MGFYSFCDDARQRSCEAWHQLIDPIEPEANSPSTHQRSLPGLASLCAKRKRWSPSQGKPVLVYDGSTTLGPRSHERAQISCAAANAWTIARIAQELVVGRGIVSLDFPPKLSTQFSQWACRLMPEDDDVIWPEAHYKAFVVTSIDTCRLAPFRIDDWLFR